MEKLAGGGLGSTRRSQVARGAPLRSRSPVWRPAGGRRAPTLRSRLFPQVSPSPAAAGKPTARLHLPHRACIPPASPSLHKKAGRAPAPLTPQWSWAAPSTPPRRTSRSIQAPHSGRWPSLAARQRQSGRLHASWEHWDWRAERLTVPNSLSTPSSSQFSLPPPPPPSLARRCRRVFGAGEGTRRAVGAGRAVELRLLLLLGRSAEVAAPRLPGLPQRGQSSRSPSLQLEGAGQEGPPNSSSASPLHPPWPLPLEKVECASRLSLFLRTASRGTDSAAAQWGFPRFARRCGSPLAHLGRRWGKVCGRQRPAADWDWDTCCPCWCYLPWPCSAPAARARPLKVRGFARLQGHLPSLLPSLLLPLFLPSSPGFLNEPPVHSTRLI